MFVISPFVIAGAPYESTMGLVQKVFYYHMPSAWLFLTASVVCGIAAPAFWPLATRATIARRWRRRRWQCSSAC